MHFISFYEYITAPATVSLPFVVYSLARHCIDLIEDNRIVLFFVRMAQTFRDPLVSVQRLDRSKQTSLARQLLLSLSLCSTPKAIEKRTTLI